MAATQRDRWRHPERVVPHGTWTAARVIDALQDWARQFGEPPRRRDWSVAHARDEGIAASRIERWKAEYPRWPSSATVVAQLGSWSAGLEAAGLRDEHLAPWEMPLPERIATAQRLAAAGMSLEQIASMVRVGSPTVARYLQARACPECGGPVVSPRAAHCPRCAPRFRPQRWTKAAVSAALKDWARDHGGPPLAQDWVPGEDPSRVWVREYPRWPTASQAQRAFGTWAAALSAAGFAAEEWQREDILRALRRLGGELARTPMGSDLRPKRPGRPGYDTTTALFGSFSAALVAAGFTPRARAWSREDVIAALRRWADEAGRAPTYDDWKRATPEHPTSGLVAQTFGSWSAGLLAADLPIANRRWTEEQIVDALRQWAAAHGRPPQSGDWADADPSGQRPGYLVVWKRFGTWEAGLGAAGLTAVRHRWTRDEVIAALRASASTLGRSPTAVDWDFSTPDHPTSATVAGMFGSWPDALLCAELSINRRFRWTADDVVAAIAAWTHTHGRPPTRADWARSDPGGRHPGTGTVHSRFGAWDAALSAAGVR